MPQPRRLVQGNEAVAEGAIAAVKQVRPKTRIVVLTVHDELGYVRAAGQAGAVGYVVKSAVDTELLAAIRAVAQGGTFIDDALAAARRLRNPLSVAFACHIAANAQYLLDAPEECARLSAESSRAAEEHRLIFWLAVGDVMGGWAATRAAGPFGPRKTMGQCICPPDM